MSAIRRAQAAIDLGRAQDAEREAKAAIAEEPNNAHGHALLARALAMQRRWSEAKTTIEHALALDPDDEWSHRVYAMVLLGLGIDPEGALSAANAALALAPEEAQAHAMRARALDALGIGCEARAALEAALALDPENLAFKLALAQRSIEHEPELAERLFREILSVTPDHAHALNNLGVILLRKKRPYDAALAFKAAVVADPTLEVAKENARSSVGSMLSGVPWGVSPIAWILARPIDVIARETACSWRTPPWWQR